MASFELKDAVKFFQKKFKSVIASRNTDIIGLDIGLSSVKMMQIKSTNSGYIITHYTETPLPEGTIIEDEVHDPETLTEKIKETYLAGKFTTESVCFGLWGNNTLVRKIQIPAPDEDDDLDDHVIWESEQYIPFDVEDCFITYEKLGVNDGGGIDLILAAAKKSVVSTFRDCVESAGLFVKIVDHSAVAFVNSFTSLYKLDAKETEGTICLCEIGAQKTFFYIVKDNQINFYKELSIGGQMITEEIQRRMGVTFEEADDLKINGDGSGKIPEEINVITDEVIGIIGNEISDAVEFYKSSMSEANIIKMYISGKTSQLNGCIETIETLTTIKISSLSLASSVSFANGVSEDNQLLLKKSGFVVFGLSLRQSND